MTHRPATFAALLGLTRAASALGDFWIQDDFCARVKGASDDHLVTYQDPVTEEKTVHGTADGRMACLHHCLSVWLVADRDIGRPALSLIRNAATRRVAARQLS
ncbi:hypothetical protein AB0451_33415 [Streptomyces sp. NPDC052000]|uniref:hypothetical protein n=1 Tax=Streptomyces sp. NPDC052000 TaxID=3155676 RepID=UPI00344D28F6